MLNNLLLTECCSSCKMNMLGIPACFSFDVLLLVFCILKWLRNPFLLEKEHLIQTQAKETWNSLCLTLKAITQTMQKKMLAGAFKVMILVQIVWMLNGKNNVFPLIKGVFNCNWCVPCSTSIQWHAQRLI